jgi:glycosyl transferase family 25
MVTYGRKVFMPIDQTMDRFWENGIVPYVIRPFPVRQRRDFASTIGGRSPERRVKEAFMMRMRRRTQRMTDGLRKRVFNFTYRWRLRGGPHPGQKFAHPGPQRRRR